MNQTEYRGLTAPINGFIFTEVCHDMEIGSAFQTCAVDAGALDKVACQSRVGSICACGWPTETVLMQLYCGFGL